MPIPCRADLRLKPPDTLVRALRKLQAWCNDGGCDPGARDLAKSIEGELRRRGIAIPAAARGTRTPSVARSRRYAFQDPIGARVIRSRALADLVQGRLTRAQYKQIARRAERAICGCR